jgi:HEAT repeat protein
MRRWIVLGVAACAVAASAAEAWAHGGQYSPPPPPPPPAPSIGAPHNPAKDKGPPPPGPATTPGDVFGPSTPRDPHAPATAETPGAHDASHWTRWWHASRWEFVGDAIYPAATADGTELAVRQRAVDALTAVLTDPNEDLASGACIALGRIGTPTVARPLLQRLRDRQAPVTVRESAALGLGLMPRGVPATESDGLVAIAICATEPVRLRAMATYAISLRHERSGAGALVDIADDPNAPLDVACAARTAVGIQADPAGGARSDLEGWLAAPGRDDAAVFRRAYAAHGLSRLRDAAAVPALRRAATDGDAHVRAAALSALGALTPCDDDTARLLVAALRDEDSACRGAAALSLGRSGQKSARAALEEALRAKDDGLRCHAALGLGLLARRVGDPFAAGAVQLLLKDRSDRDLRAAAAVACGLARLKTAAPDLRDIAGDDVAGEPRAYAALALGMIGDAESIPVLRTLLRNETLPVLPWEAATALGLLGDPTALAELRRAVEESPSLYVQGNAAVGVGRIGGAAAAQFLVELVKDEKRPGIVRAMAAVGIGLALGGGPAHGYGAVAADLPWIVATPTVAEMVSIL